MVPESGHLAVAYAMGKTVNPMWHLTRFGLLMALCCVLPEVDVLGLEFR